MLDEMIESLIRFQDLVDAYSGGSWQTMIWAGAALLVMIVLGSILASRVFRKESGGLKIVLHLVIPLIAALAVWAAIDGPGGNPILAIGDGSLPWACVASGLSFVLLLWLLDRWFLQMGGFQIMLFALLTYAAAAGGVAVANASITVFSHGKGVVESRQVNGN